MKNYKSDKPCEVCGEDRDNYVCYHHMITRGAGGSDHPFNLMSLCQEHHNEIHNTSLEYMVDTYGLEMVLRGWELNAYGEWVAPAECYR